ncbi:MAG: ECF transporter S component [Bacillota bacterium]
MRIKRVRLLTQVALFVALGLLLPVIFHAAGLGRVFLPMHIPVFLAGFYSGPLVGAITGAITPILSGVLTGMPTLMPPVAQPMAFELGTYGCVAGALYWRKGTGVLPSLLAAMLAGRLVYGLVGALVLPLFGLKGISLLYPLTAGLISGLPGIAVQLVVIPLLTSRIPPRRLEGRTPSSQL